MRLFVAIALPAAIKDELGALIESQRGALPTAKWVPRENLHLTLSFLGEVSEERVDAIVTALANAVAGVAPFEARLGGTGAFPTPRRARVYWAGLEAPEGRLHGVADAVAASVEPLGFPPEARAWTPHVTLARMRAPGSLTGLPAVSPDPLAFSVSEVTLFRSRLSRPAPRYQPVAGVPFGG